MTHDGIGVVEAAVFALLGLLLGFSFADGTSRLEARRQLIVQEANAIATAYERLDLLPAGEQPAMRHLFREYLDARLRVYAKLPDLRAADQELERVGQMLHEIWSRAVGSDRTSSTENVSRLLLPAINQLIDVTTGRTLALHTHLPLLIFLFNIFNPGGGAASQSLVLAPAQTTFPDASQFTPPQITQASFANYPAASTAQGTVVLDVTVGRAGQPKQIRVINDVPTLSAQAVSAVKTWGFNAATIDGQPVPAQIVIAFVFQRNMS